MILQELAAVRSPRGGGRGNGGWSTLCELLDRGLCSMTRLESLVLLCERRSMVMLSSHLRCALEGEEHD